MSLAFVPLYIKYLGIEAYGLIGIFALLQTWMWLLDMGMTPTLSREMARYTGGAHDAQSIRDLLRSIEIIGLSIAALVALGIWAASGWLASDWLRAEKLSIEAIAQAFAIMGVVTALRFLENIYRSSIVGLQRQVLLNVLTSVMAMLRGLGAVGVLVCVSPTIEAFFLWQCLISIATVVLFAIVVYRTLPMSHQPARFSLPALIGIWRFAASMVAITLTSLLLMQVDKIILSRLLTLEAFGYYTLSAVVANALYMIANPINQAIYPHFTELLTKNDQASLISAYHKGAQLITVLMGSAAIVLIFFGEVVFALWTHDTILARRVAPLVAVLALGTLLNGLMHIPYQLQLSYGWTSLTLRINIVAVAVLVPAILWATPTYGAIGAAWIWVTLNVCYLIFAIYFMHRRLLPTEKWRWYRQDVAIPLIASTAIAGLLRCAMPTHLSALAQLIGLLFAAGLVLATASIAAPVVRQQILGYLLEIIKSKYTKEA